MSKIDISTAPTQDLMNYLVKSRGKGLFAHRMKFRRRILAEIVARTGEEHLVETTIKANTAVMRDGT